MASAFTPQHVGILQSILTPCAKGYERDLWRAERLDDPSAILQESSVCTRLLGGLERGVVLGPDCEASIVVRKLLIAADEANGYATAVAEHDALSALLNQVEGKET